METKNKKSERKNYKCKFELIKRKNNVIIEKFVIGRKL